MSNPGPFITTSNHPSNPALNQAIRLIGSLQGMDLNKIADTVVTVLDTNSWAGLLILVTNASTNMTTAEMSIFTAPNGGGTNMGTPVLNTLTNQFKISAFNPMVDERQVVNTLYFRCTTPQGAPATADVYLYGFDFSFLP